MNIWHDISPEKVKPEEFTCVIEITKGSKCKYELDKSTGLLALDRILHTSTHYPANYGFIPKTYADDGDPLDVMLLCSENIQPMTLVNCRPIGIMFMIDSGSKDEKIIAVPIDDPVYKHYQDVSELPNHIFEEMRHFFAVYKELENKKTIVENIGNHEEAIKIIAHTINLYNDKFKS